jgi:hypothetical protein
MGLPFVCCNQVKLTFRIINGSGVTNKRVLSGVIKPE